MKKVVSLLLAAAMMTAVASASCGGRGGGQHRQARSAQTQVQAQHEWVACSIDDCGVYGVHAHDGTYYLCAAHDDCAAYFCGGERGYNRGCGRMAW